jgi:hypothetical protein
MKRPRTEYVSDASLCRAHGWKRGDVLHLTRSRYLNHTPREKRGRITAIGEESILVRLIDGKGKEGREVRWSRQLYDFEITREVTTKAKGG